MEFQQHRNSNRIRFVFRDDELEYSLKDSSGSRTFAVPYTDISRDRQTLIERNAWLRNVGLLWIAIGVVSTAIKWFDSQQFQGSIWLFLGAACYAAYRLRSTAFTLVPTDRGDVYVIDGPDGQRILQEIEQRRAQAFRAQAFRAEYDFIPEGDTPEQLRNRFKWLHREGALSDQELEQRLRVVEEMHEPARAAGLPVAARGLLN